MYEEIFIARSALKRSSIRTFNPHGANRKRQREYDRKNTEIRSSYYLIVRRGGRKARRFGVYLVRPVLMAVQHWLRRQAHILSAGMLGHEDILMPICRVFAENEEINVIIWGNSARPAPGSFMSPLHVISRRKPSCSVVPLCLRGP